MLSAGQNTVKALVIYDISNNRTRREVVKTLSGYGNRVQKSAFEMSGLTKKALKHMMKDIERIRCDPDGDSIRLYLLEDAGVHKVYGMKEQGISSRDADGTAVII